MYKNENVPFQLLTRLHKKMVWCKDLRNITNRILYLMRQLEFLENREKIMIKLYYFFVFSPNSATISSFLRRVS